VVDLVYLLYKREFVTAYLGKPVDYTYMHGDIVSLPTKCSNQGINEEYWLGHRINHGSRKKKNIEIRANMVMRATKKIKIGEELFCDYNRDVLCAGCNNLIQLISTDKYTNMRCIKCGIKKSVEKWCRSCNNYMCGDCYDSFQINLDHYH
jgi:hypothetical protein